MSANVSIATPTLPTSPAARGSSESIPICVGRSSATEKPVSPASSSERKRAFASAGVPKPPYWPMIQTPGSGLIPRVYGNSPGRSVPAEGGPGRSSVTRRLRVSFPDFDDDRLALADATADRGQSVVRAPVALATPAPELVDQRHDEPRAGRARRVADRDRAAVDVRLGADLLGLLPVASRHHERRDEGHGRERLVDL